MPAFEPPFVGNYNKISDLELAQAIRLNIASELEAITVYDAHANSTNNKTAKKIIESIRDEEKVHVGELITLLGILEPGFKGFLKDGEKEVKDTIQKML